MSEQDFTTIPQVEGVVIPPGTPYSLNHKKQPTSRRWLILVRCPYCGRQHEHGWQDGPADIKTRKSHCAGRPIKTHVWGRHRKTVKIYPGGGEYEIIPVRTK